MRERLSLNVSVAGCVVSAVEEMGSASLSVLRNSQYQAVLSGILCLRSCGASSLRSREKLSASV